MNAENRAIIGLPLVKFAPFLAIGLLTAYYGGSLASAIVIGCSAAALLLAAVLKKPICAPAAGLLCGAVLTLGFMQLRVLPVTRYCGETVDTQFVVEQVVSHSEDRQEVVARLSLGGVSTKATLYCDNVLSEGQNARAVISFGEYDEKQAAYNIASGILLSGEAQITAVGDISSAALLPRAVRAVRDSFAGHIRENIGGDMGELALSMLFGIDDSLPNYLAERLRVCGAMHFTSVSGSHFTIIAALLFGMIPDSRRRLKAGLALLFAPVAVLFFGPQSSVIRACAMFVVYSVSALFRRQSETLNTLCAAYSAICIISPASAVDIGFQMSVCGVLGAGVVGVKTADRLKVLFSEKYRRYDSAVRLLLISVGAVICTAPLSAMHFQGYSIAGAFTTVVMMPLMALAFLFALILGVTGFGLMAVPLAVVMEPVALIANTLGKLRGLWVTADHIGGWAALAIAAVTAMVFAMGSFRFIEVSACCCSALLAFTLAGTLYMEENRLKYVVVENTQGRAAIIVTGNRAQVNIEEIDGYFSRTLLNSLRENGARVLTEVHMEDNSYCGTLTALDLLYSFGQNRPQ